MLALILLGGLVIAWLLGMGVFATLIWLDKKRQLPGHESTSGEIKKE